MTMFTDIIIGVCIAGLLKVVIDSVQALRFGFAVLGSCPGHHTIWVHPFRAMTLIVAPYFPPRGWMSHYAGKFSPYAEDGSTILSSLVFWGAHPIFWLADPDAIKTVTSDRHTYRKEIEPYVLLEVYGPNLISTEGDEWRRHLGVTGPAFNDSNYTLAWSETRRIMFEWFEELDNNPLTAPSMYGKIIDVKEAMTRATLLIISSAGFGMQTPWSAFAEASHKYLPAGGNQTLPFHTSLALTIEKLFIKVITPPFALALPFRVPWLSRQLEVTQTAFDSLKFHMLELVSSARSGGEGEANLLKRLVQANDEGVMQTKLGGKGTLSDSELLGNMFAFLLAGHETTAHTMTFAIMLLAIYPEVQKKLRSEVLRVWPTADDVHSSTYKRDFEKLEYTLAVFRETLRCFPSEPRLNKTVEADVVLTGTRFTPSSVEPRITCDGALTNVEFTRDKAKDEKFEVHIPKGSTVAMDIWATHMNPLVWGPDAHLFVPERFIDTAEYKWPRDALLAFSAGPRGCLGQRFAMAEVVCLLACLVWHYELLPPEGIDAKSMPEEVKRRMLRWTTGITITPTNAFIRMRRY